MAGTTTDTVPTMLTPGEFVIKRESAKMLGLPFLRKLNAVSDNAAHENIDELIRQAHEFKTMKGGGEVIQGYDDGGKVFKEGTDKPPQNLSALMQSYTNQYGAAPMSLYIREMQGLQNPEQEILAEILGTTPKLNMTPELPKYNPEEFEGMMQGMQDGDEVGKLEKLLSMITQKGENKKLMKS